MADEKLYNNLQDNDEPAKEGGTNQSHTAIALPLRARQLQRQNEVRCMFRIWQPRRVSFMTSLHLARVGTESCKLVRLVRSMSVISLKVVVPLWKPRPSSVRTGP